MQDCTINVTSGGYDDRIYGAGYRTAQGRTNMRDRSGFVFKYCVVVGTSYAYLGRPYQSYSRVVFYKTYLSSIIVPQGWNPTFTLGHEYALFFLPCFLFFLANKILYSSEKINIYQGKYKFNLFQLHQCGNEPLLFITLLFQRYLHILSGNVC